MERGMEGGMEGGGRREEGRGMEGGGRREEGRGMERGGRWGKGEFESYLTIFRSVYVMIHTYPADMNSK